MRFADIPGFADLKQTLARAAGRAQVAHAQLWLGPEGSAQLPLALAFATLLNCERRTPDSTDACGACDACQKNLRFVHPDLHFIFPAVRPESKREQQIAEQTRQWRQFLTENPYGHLADWSAHLGAAQKAPTIGAEEGREVIRRLALKAYEGTYKVLLLWLPELLHVAAANALLKILEEPPAQTVFLLVSQQENGVLPTIRSRTQTIRLRPFEHAEVAQYLQAHEGASADKAAQVARLAEGNLRAARHLLHHETHDYHTLMAQWLRRCYQRDLAGLLDETEAFQKLNREGQKHFFAYGLSLLREVLMFQVDERGLSKVTGQTLTFVQNFGRLFGPDQTAQLVQLFQEAAHHLERNANPKILMLDVSLQVAQLLVGVRRAQAGSPA